jgi:hypothetical protein
MQQWNLDIQHELGRQMVLEVLYAGSSGTGLPAQWASQMNQLADSHLSMGTALRDPVRNPFYGIVQAGPLAQPTVQRGQLLRPYPQFQTLYIEGMPLGHSTYHSFQLLFNKRFGSSIVGAAYTIARRSATPKAEATGWKAAHKEPAWASSTTTTAAWTAAWPSPTFRSAWSFTTPSRFLSARVSAC